ncbi:MAG: hypothetical protein ACI9UO_003102, partial [Nitrospinales bacterium]
VFLIISSTVELRAQVYSNRPVGEKNIELVDSLKKTDYPYVLPIWGDKAVEAGFDIPYSAGLGVNYLWQESKVKINELSVGVNNSQLFDLDEIVRFNDATATSNIVNFRPDIWLFPFLNIYGIIAVSETSTMVDFGVWAPNGTSTEEIFNYQTTANFNATSLGFGITPTVGVGGGWLALDMNFTWTDIPELDKPNYSFVFGPRLGKSFQLKKPESNVAIWVGGFRVAFGGDLTTGGLSLSEVLPEDGNLQGKLNTGLDKIEIKSRELDEWYNGLSPVQQTVNTPKYNAALRVLAGANQALTGLSDAAENATNSTINYSLNKGLKDKWNFITGAQYQLNKHWMIRGEAGFLKSRTQALVGLQYRFGL